VDPRPAATRYRLILDLAREVTAQRDLADVLATTFASLRELVDFGGGSIALVDDEGWISFAATDPPATAEALTVRIRVGDGITGRIVETCEPAYIGDIHVHPDVTEERRQKSVSAGVIAWFGAPLVIDGRAIGVLQIDSPVAGAWSDEDRVLLLSFTPIVAAAVQNARLYAREQAAVQRLSELDRRHRDFVAMVSHELRTPLTSIMGYAETIVTHADKLGLDGVLGLVGRVQGAAERLGGMVEQLLDLSVLQRGELRLDLAPVDVAVAVAQAIAKNAPSDRKVGVHVPPDLPEVVTDGTRLTQMLGHLVDNAVKFSAPDTPVDVTVTAEDGTLALRVTDAGDGIPPEDHDRVFERFVQLDSGNTRRVGGFGLGLYVVREVCEALGGTVTVESAAGEGAAFTLRLPLRPLAA
jgi:signal transduction histidine kinase